jgi:hypothetical protein
MTDNPQEQSPEEGPSFEDIVSNSDKVDANQGRDVSLWDVLGQLMSKFYPGKILTKGVLILDLLSTDDLETRELRWAMHRNTMPWEALGMAHQIINDLEAENSVIVSTAMADDEDDDDEQ